MCYNCQRVSFCCSSYCLLLLAFTHLHWLHLYCCLLFAYSLYSVWLLVSHLLQFHSYVSCELAFCGYVCIFMLAHMRSTCLVVEKWKIGRVWWKTDTWSNSHKTQMLVNLHTFPLWNETVTLASTKSRKQEKISENRIKFSKFPFCVGHNFVLKWSEVSYVEVLGDKSTMHIRVTLYWGYLIVLWLFYLVCILYCGCCNLYCNVCVCVYVWVL